MGNIGFARLGTAPSVTASVSAIPTFIMTGQCEGSVRVGIWESWTSVAGGEAANGRSPFKPESNREVDKREHASAPFWVPLIHGRE
jgi:hypothetical protein